MAVAQASATRAGTIGARRSQTVGARPGTSSHPRAAAKNNFSAKKATATPTSKAHVSYTASRCSALSRSGLGQMTW